MNKFSRGDRVRIIEVPEHGKHHLNKTGRVEEPPEGAGYKDDDIKVVFDIGGFGFFKESQVEALD